MAKGNILSLKFLFIAFVDSLSCFVLYNKRLIQNGNTNIWFIYKSSILHRNGNIYEYNKNADILSQNEINCNSNTVIAWIINALQTLAFPLISHENYVLRFNMSNDCERNYSYHKLNCLYIPVVHVYGEH